MKGFCSPDWSENPFCPDFFGAKRLQQKAGKGTVGKARAIGFK